MTPSGGSVINALLADGIFTPRAVTRSTNSPAAKALEARGCEVVEADLGSKEAVRRAVEGAECVFGVSGGFLGLDLKCATLVYLPFEISLTLGRELANGCQIDSRVRCKTGADLHTKNFTPDSFSH